MSRPIYILMHVRVCTLFLSLMQPRTTVNFLSQHEQSRRYVLTTYLLEFLTKAKVELEMKLNILYFSLESLNMIVVLQRSA